MTRYFVSKPIKSKGIAAILVFLFWPVGLFYSSVIGGLVMSFIIGPLVLLTMDTPFIYLLLPIYFFTCLIWALIAVSNYNRKLIIEVESRNQLIQEQPTATSVDEDILNAKNEINKNLEIIQNLYDQKIISVDVFDSQKEALQKKIALLTSNEKKQPVSADSKYEYQEIYEEKKSNKWLWILTVLLILSWLFLLYDTKTNNFNFDKLKNVISFHSKDKEAIKDQIEKTYFGILNSQYNSQSTQGIWHEGVPFYNLNMKDAFFMADLALLNLDGSRLNLDPKNIEVYEFLDDATAKVKFDLIMKWGERNGTLKIDMIVKKIGGFWKLDGEKILGSFQEATDEKKGRKEEKELAVQEDDYKISSDDLNNPKNSAWKIISAKEKSDEKQNEVDNQYFLFIGKKVYLIKNGGVEKLWHFTKKYFSDEYLIHETKEGDEFSQFGNITITSQNNYSIEYEGYDVPLKEVVIDKLFIR